MSEQKPRQFRSTIFTPDGSTATARPTQKPEQQGWDAYRKWLSRVASKPAEDRAPLDHSIYSWRGYHTWADKIRQSWKSEG